jgi:hypothetical protein
MRLFLTLMLILLSPAAFAAESGMGSFSGWKAFRVIEKEQHVCYMIAHAPLAPAPKVKKAKGKKEAAPAARDAYVMLTFRPSETTAPVFTYNAGTVLKDGAEAALTSGKEKITLFIAGDAAWARTSTVDRDIAQLLKKGEGKMEIAAPGAKGSALRDTFSLKGADSAYKKITTACGIP